MRIATFTAFCLFAVVGGCARESEPNASTSPKTATGPEPSKVRNSAAVESPLLAGGRTVDVQQFRINLPKGWQLKEDRIMAVHAVESLDQVFPNLKVAILKPPRPVTVQEVVQNSKQQWAKFWTVEKEAAVTIGDQPASRIILVSKIPNSDSRQLKYFVAAGSRILIITAQAKPEDFEARLPLFEAIVQSLNVTM